jgi:hypothetical protein
MHDTKSQKQIPPMKAIDRVMRAYSRTRELSGEQADLVRRELSRFIDQLMLGRSLHPSDDNDGGPLKSG